MNDSFKQLKERLRRLEELLQRRGATEDPGFAQAVSSLRRATGRADRTREPTPELLNLLARAESSGRALLP